MSAAAVIMIRVKRVFAFLRDCDALSSETAVPTKDVPYSNKWYFRRLVRRGVVQIRGDRCYLDDSKAKLYLHRLRVRSLVIIALVVIACMLRMIAK